MSFFSLGAVNHSDGMSAHALHQELDDLETCARQGTGQGEAFCLAPLRVSLEPVDKITCHSLS